MLPSTPSSPPSASSPRSCARRRLLGCRAVIAAEQAQTPVDPCHDPALELVCPNLVMPPPSRLTLRRTGGGRRLLQMDNYLLNEGPGRVTIRGHRTAGYTMEAVQLADRRGAAPVALNTGAVLTWKYVDRRRRSFWKFRHAARFELWRLDARG